MKAPPVTIYVQTNEHGALGVALVQQIVEESGVRIKVRSVVKTAEGRLEIDDE